MGRRGPRPVPDAILEARGSDVPGRRALARKRKGEVVVAAAAPVEVAAVGLVGLDGVPTLDQARAVVARAVGDAGVLGGGQELAMEMFARAVVRYHEARQRLRLFQEANEAVSLDGSTAYVEMMLDAAYSKAELAVMKACREFGLTPASVSEVPRAKAKPVENEEAPKKAPIRRSL